MKCAQRDSTMLKNNFNIDGLTNEQIVSSRQKFGSNSLNYKKESGTIDIIKKLATEPMVLILLAASVIYFISGKIGDGIFLACAILFEIGMSLYQDARSRNALEKLKNFVQPKCKVIRNGMTEEIKNEDLVVGDCLMVEEGTSISADGVIIHSNDFSVNESILTGESMPVFKDFTKEDKTIYSGTTVASGLAIATVTAVGNATELGKIGKSLESIEEEKTPLELQINNFVKKLVILGAIVFAIVWIENYVHSKNVLNSLLQALTLAMSILPEEIPVAFTTFMALGAWRLMKMGVVVKQMKTVETLGSATVICTDKTGTLTENKMELSKLFVLSNDSNQPSTITDLIFEKLKPISSKLKAEKELIGTAMWASEPIPFDPMEIALHSAYEKIAEAASIGGQFNDERKNFNLVHEYPLGGVPPMMTHIFEDNTGARIIAAKGAPEAIIQHSNLTPIEMQQINEAIKELTSEGYRVLGVARALSPDRQTNNNYPETQQEFKFDFKGIVAFYDPPKKNIEAVLKNFYNAGIKVKIVTGDNAETTAAIAKEIGFNGHQKTVMGLELMKLTDEELKICVKKSYIFARMFPEAKLKIINALKASGEIVAMTGDGVNDAPALKAAHIGIAMGKKGTEIAKQAASLILINDDLSSMVDAVAMGRRIYTNLKKAIQYIISIHIPIILTVFIPLVLGWIYPNIFSPVHIIFLELIMGPTCSIIFENEPIEKNIMHKKPRPFSTTFFNWKELTTSVIQGLIVTVGTLCTYQYAVHEGFDQALTRTMVFTVLITANIFLTLVNRSFYYSIFTTLLYKNNLILLIIFITVAMSTTLIYVSPLNSFFEFESLSLLQLGLSISIGMISVVWFEIVKIFARIQTKKH